MSETVALTTADAGELLTLQRAAYASEAQLYRDAFLPALTQTLPELQEELAGSHALGIREGARLVAAVRWTVDGDTAHIGRLVVAPDRQGAGLGTTLLRAAQDAAATPRSELFTGHLSAANIRLYAREGYVETQRVPLREGVELVYLSREA